MKTADIRAKSADELKQELINLSKEQFNFRFQKSTGQLETSSQARIRTVRRDIAKIKTILAEQKSGKAAPKAAAKAAKKPAAKKKKDQE